MRVTPAHLFVLLGRLNAHTKRLGALVALWTGQAVETWVGVDAALRSTHFVANVRHHVTLEEEIYAWSICKQIITRVNERQMQLQLPAREEKTGSLPH